MKALTISQPFASLIADGEKWVENRTWPTRYTGPLAIHAGKGQQYLKGKQLAEYPTGVIVATAERVLCMHQSRILELAASMIGDEDGPAGCDHTWADIYGHEHTIGPWCWILIGVKKLETPVPATGRQGLWDWNP